MPVSGAEAARYFKESGFQCLAIEPEHILMIEQLPVYHADPFDRVIIAQVLTEPMRLITHNATISQYSGTIISV